MDEKAFRYERYADNELTAVPWGEGVTLSVVDEVAVDSYNKVFTCSISLDRDEMARLRDWLNDRLADDRPA